MRLKGSLFTALVDPARDHNFFSDFGDHHDLQKQPSHSQRGLQMTGFPVALGMLSGIALGTLLAIVRGFGPKPLSALAAVSVNVFRSIPLTLTILWVYFLMPWCFAS